MSDASAYAVIRKAIQDVEFRATLLKDPMGTMAREGIDEPAERQELLNILKLMQEGGASEAQQQKEFLAHIATASADTFDVIAKMKTGLKETIDQIDKAFRSTMLMYQVSFYLGVALILAAIAFALVAKESFLPMVFGGLGTADLLTFFFTKPPERLQSSRASLAQLQIALLYWFADLVEQSDYTYQLNQKDALNLDTFQRLRDAQMEHTERVMRILQTYCKLTEATRAAVHRTASAIPPAANR